MLACNKHIACTPFESKALDLQVKSAFAVAKQKVTLTALTVVFGDDDLGFNPGDKAWVKGDAYKTYGKDEYEVDGVVFVLVPLSAVLVRTDKPIPPVSPYTQWALNPMPQGGTFQFLPLEFDIKP